MLGARPNFELNLSGLCKHLSIGAHMRRWQVLFDWQTAGRLPSKKGMTPIREVADQPLEWRQLNLFGCTKECELRAADAVAARLHVRDWFGLSGRAESTDGEWIFDDKPEGRVRMRPSGSESEGLRWADLKGLWLLVGCGSGHIYKWLTPGLRDQFREFWLSMKSVLGFPMPPGEQRYRLRPRFTDESGEPVVSFELKSYFPKSKCKVSIAPRASSNPDISFLTLLGWYLILWEEANQRATLGPY